MKRYRHVLIFIWFSMLSGFHSDGVAGDLGVGGGVFINSGQALGDAVSTAVALGDLDNDGDLDAFVTNGLLGNEVNEVWLNNGAGIFTANGQTLPADVSLDVVLGDVDEDEDLDAVVAHDDGVRIWLNDGTAQFSDSGQNLTTNGAFPQGLAVADLDEDGDLDIFVASSGPGGSGPNAVWLNGQGPDPPGLFSPGQTFGSAENHSVDLADLDGDGDPPDAVITGNGPVTVWLNDGNATFSDSGQTLGTGNSWDTALADVDGDNDVDIFVAKEGADLVWLNDGSGVFSSNGQSLGTAVSLDIALADVDGDHDQDAFVANGFAGNELWLNDGSGQFSLAQTMGNFLNTSYGVALGDLDNDGDPDAFVAKDGPNEVWLNQSPPPIVLDWRYQVVEARGYTGEGPSLALDENDYPHISYIRRLEPPTPSYVLVYAYWDGVIWHTESVELNYTMGNTTSLVLDSNGRPHITYLARRDDTTSLHDLRYAFHDGNQWQVDTVLEEALILDTVQSLALDNNGIPHVSFIQGDGLRYATYNGANWILSSVDSAAVGPDSSLALDSNGRAHISYRAGNNGRILKYARWNGSAWDLSIVDGDIGAGTESALVLDTANNPHIAYDSAAGLTYASWDGATWQFQLAAALSYGAFGISMALDADDNAHIGYTSPSSIAPPTNRVHYVYYDGSSWQTRPVATSTWTENVWLALDTAGNPHLALRDGHYDDLVYAVWGPAWQTRTVDTSAEHASLALESASDPIPHISYYHPATGLLRLASWQTGGWSREGVAFLVNAGVHNQLRLPISSEEQISYYDTDQQDMIFTKRSGLAWQLETVDSAGDVGRYNALLEDAIAYWDATNFRVKLALYDEMSGTWQSRTNSVGPSLNAGSGYLSAARWPDGSIIISYYRDGAAELRLATWDGSAWGDEIVVGGVEAVGPHNDLEADIVNGWPVVAYYSQDNQTLRYAYRDESGWQKETVTAVPGLSSLSLELSLGSYHYPVVAYTTANTLYVAFKTTAGWQVKTVSNDPGLGDVSLALGNRFRLAYPSSSGLEYTFSTATAFVEPPINYPPYNPAAPDESCAALLWPDRSLAELSPVTAVPTGGEPLDDSAIFGALGALFAASPGGQNYVSLYSRHGAEMAEIGLDDLELLWDSYGTLQNLLPGLEALVTGRGEEVIVSQEAVDDALEIWTRLAVAGSPELAAIINSELAAYNNLQDFVGLTFDEWAMAIGVNPPSYQVYLPVVTSPESGALSDAAQNAGLP